MGLTIFERIGGEVAVMAAVDLLYEKVISDPLTSPFFAHLDIRALAKKQIAFMACALGGPEEYKGRDIRAAHKALVELGLTDVHFDRVVRHLDATLRELGIREELIREVLTTVEGTRSAVLNR